MAAELKPDRAIVPIVRYAPERPISEVLGTGFFVGNMETIHLVTAKHVISSSPLAEGEKFALVFNDGKGTAIIAISQVRAARDFDVAVCSVSRSHLELAVPLAIARSDPALNDDVFSYEYSSTRIERTATGTHVSFDPYTHKGNVVRSYVSTFPETVKTPTILTSYPALQGASGAPVIAPGPKRQSFAVVGMLVANSERHLLPAQVVKIEDGPSYSETTSYFLPYGKALSWSVLTQCLEGMGVPFAYASDADA
jgi:hypothetical protein